MLTTHSSRLKVETLCRKAAALIAALVAQVLVRSHACDMHNMISGAMRGWQDVARQPRAATWSSRGLGGKGDSQVPSKYLVPRYRGLGPKVGFWVWVIGGFEMYFGKGPWLPRSLASALLLTWQYVEQNSSGSARRLQFQLSSPHSFSTLQHRRTSTNGLFPTLQYRQTAPI